MDVLNPADLIEKYDDTDRSAAINYILQSVTQIEDRVNEAAESDSFTKDELDVIELIFDQYKKLTQLSGKSNIIDDLLKRYDFLHRAYGSDSDKNGNTSSTSNSLQHENDERETHPFIYVCEVCDEEFPILNDDLNYSSQLHFRSSSHLEAESFLRKIREFQLESVSFNDDNESCDSVSFVSPSKIENSMSKNSRRNSVGPNLEAGTSWSDEKFSAPHKTWCSSQPSWKQKQMGGSRQTSSIFISDTEASFGRFDWIEAKGQTRLFYWDEFEFGYYCCLCRSYLPSQHNFDHHVYGSYHTANVIGRLQQLEYGEYRYAFGE